MSNNSRNAMIAKHSNGQSASAHETSTIFSYQGSKITFQNGDNVMVNATQMAKSFGKQPIGWLRSSQSEEFIKELSELRNCSSADLVKVRRGGNTALQGTWMHQDVALEFARWLSPAFAIWTNDRIKELLTQGVATVRDDDETILHAMNVLQRRVDSYKQRNQILEGEVELQRREIEQLAPKAAYTDEVLQSTSTFTTTQVAKDLSMSAVTLNRLLKQHGVQHKQSGQWFLYHKYQDMGLADMRVARYIDRKTGEVKTSQSMVWTERGRKFIIDLINREAGINTKIAKGAAV